MIDIMELFTNLKESIEMHEKDLKQGDLFFPKYLSGHALTRDVFPKIIKTLTSSLGLELISEYRNNMPTPEVYKCGQYQVVDYLLHRVGVPKYFLELESLDRSQLNTFLEHEDISENNNENKLWYYYGTLIKHYTFGESVPKYFVWLLILTNHQVEPYQIWDVAPEYKFFHTSLKPLIYQNPYRFYDNLIKSAARIFITNDYDFDDPKTRKLIRKSLLDFQDICELIFITCTIEKLIISRGKNLFNPNEEISVSLNYEEKR